MHAQRRRLRQSERRAETRHRLLDAAEAAFAERGYQAASLEEICERAGLSRGALYYNFSGKHELLLVLLDERLTDRAEQLARVPRPRHQDERDWADGTVAALRFDRSSSLLFLEFVCAAARDPALATALRERLPAMRAGMAEQTRRLLGTDPGGAVATERLTLAFAALANGLSLEALTGGDLGELEEAFATLLGLALRGLRAAA